jgi:hypothetical protein
LDRLAGPVEVVPGHAQGYFSFTGHAKTFPFPKRAKLEFRSEFFNIFNHTNPDGPGLGFVRNGAKEAREGQGSLKLSFLLRTP